MINETNSMTASRIAILNEESLEKEQLRRCETGDLFGPEYGNLPNGRFRLLSRVTLTRYETHPEGLYGMAMAELDLSPDTWFFKNHFFGDPVMPGTLQVEAVLQLAGLYLAWAGVRGVGRAREVSRTVFYDEIRPDNSTKFRIAMSVIKILGRGKLHYLTGSAFGLRDDDKQVMRMEGIKLIKAER
ncbi:MAG: hypothetical protein ACQKBV_11435 [Puniceicoccales bacterium]